MAADEAVAAAMAVFLTVTETLNDRFGIYSTLTQPWPMEKVSCKVW